MLFSNKSTFIKGKMKLLLWF